MENNKNNKNNLQPELTQPVTRQATGSLFNAQPNGGVEASVPLAILFVFAEEGAE